MTAAISIVETPGPRLIDGADINTIITVVNGLAAGTTAGVYTGTFNGIVGGTTPAAGTFTALVSTTFAPTGDITIASGKAIKTDTTDAHTAIFQAYDVDGTAYKTFATLTNGNTPSFAIAAPSGGTVTIDGAVIGGVTPVSIRGYMPIATTFSGTTGTLALVDAEYYQICNNAATQTLTIPTNASVAFDIGTEIVFFQQGVGQVVFAAAGGVTIQSVSGNLKIASQYGAATLKKIATDTWNLFGNLSA
jgi:hypothetical protein